MDSFVQSNFKTCTDYESSIITINPAQLAIQRSNFGEKTRQHYLYLLLNNDCKVKRQTQQCYICTNEFTFTISKILSWPLHIRPPTDHLSNLTQLDLYQIRDV